MLNVRRPPRVTHAFPLVSSSPNPFVFVFRIARTSPQRSFNFPLLSFFREEPGD